MAKEAKTREPQYQVQFEQLKEKGPVRMGPTVSALWRDDPRHLAFLLARYKFVSKMLAGRKRAVEVGCGDAFGMKLVLQTVEHVHGIDFDPMFSGWAADQAKREELNASFSSIDVIKTVPKGPFDCAYSLDVIEHIPKSKEKKFVGNIARSLSPHAVCILGTPNVTAKAYQSKQSEEGHINLKNHKELRALMERFFHSVFIFSMNDEVLHTGFYPMAHYLYAVGVEPRT
jgi:2-polyprenyl-3-methyl-5-hydroxy-6-metoxy-1,4-benzoquinol methylase